MSYILQALKKAEAERGLGRVPGLDAPMAAPSRAERGANPLNSLNPSWRWVALGAALTVTAAALAAWSLGWFTSTPAAAPLVAAPLVTPAAPAPISTPLLAQPQIVAAVTPVPAAVQASAPIAPLVVTPVPPPLPRLAPSHASAPAPVRATPPLSAAAAATPQPWPDTPGWPTLTLGGSVYSEVPAQRMLVINGQVLREGDAAGAELTLLRIGATSAVWRYKGGTYLWRY